jgi:hypothetical protein
VRASDLYGAGDTGSLTPASYEAPHEPVGVAPLGLALDDEGLAIDDELIAGPRVCDLAPPKLEDGSLGVDAGLAEADDRVGTTGDDPHRNGVTASRRVHGVDPERGERRVDRALERRHQVRLALISTRGRVQIGSGFDCACSMSGRVADQKGSVS